MPRNRDNRSFESIEKPKPSSSNKASSPISLNEVNFQQVWSLSLLRLHVGDVKRLEMAQEFEKYKKRAGDAADLDKFLEKKRKRKASKQKKFIPTAPATQ